MRLRQPTPDHTGSLLVALPTLSDPNFRRTILFLSHHDAQEGSVGFILNRPRGIHLGDLASTPEGGERIPVYEGGPVERKSLIVAKIQWHESEERPRFHSLGEADLAPASGAAPSGESLRAFTGYAGWSAGQLERELAEKSWIILPPSPDMLLPVETPEEGISRWMGVMRKLGPWYHLMAQTPDDISLN